MLLQEPARALGSFGESWSSPSSAIHVLGDLGELLPCSGKWSSLSRCLGAGSRGCALKPASFLPAGFPEVPQLAFLPVRGHRTFFRRWPSEASSAVPAPAVSSAPGRGFVLSAGRMPGTRPRSFS